MLRVPACVADQNIPATQTPKELAASPSASTVISARFMVYPLSGANTALARVRRSRNVPLPEVMSCIRSPWLHPES
jgi:hypothetical protein